ncbi:MAG: 6-carboxytetrahydropterin synthase [Xanthobacteraceae bacterium]|jgi:hypothetical protein
MGVIGNPPTKLRNRIGRTYHFESAHRLPLVPWGHKCKNMHGHNYRDRQPRNIYSNSPRFIPREQFRRRTPTGFVLEISVSERLSGVIPHD